MGNQDTQSKEKVVVECPECHKECSSEYKSCPHCGISLQASKSFWPPAIKRHPYLTVILIGGLFLICLILGSFPLNRVPYDSDLQRLGIGAIVIAVVVIISFVVIKLYRARRK